MTRKTYTVTFGDTTATRKSENVYTHAACRHVRYEGWKITFHKTREAARRAAGNDEGVKPVTEVAR